MNPRRSFVRLALVAHVLVVAIPAIAQDRPEDAGALKKQADAAFDAKHFEDALALYDRAYALSPQLAILYDRGRALQYLARYPQALEQLEQFDQKAPRELRAKVPGFDVLLEQVRRQVATVDVRCSVAGATVLIGSVSVGTTPLPSQIRISAGRQRVEVLADGYYPFRQDVDLPGGTVTTVSTPLVARDHHALLRVRSTVSGTAIFVDGKALGVTPTEAALLEGDHGVRATHPAYDDMFTHVVLRAGQDKEISLSPKPRPSILSRWWFWTGVAVIAAGAAVMVYALTTEQGPPTGNFSPGNINF